MFETGWQLPKHCPFEWPTSWNPVTGNVCWFTLGWTAASTMTEALGSVSSKRKKRMFCGTAGGTKNFSLFRAGLFLFSTQLEWDVEWLRDMRSQSKRPCFRFGGSNHSNRLHVFQPHRFKELWDPGFMLFKILHVVQTNVVSRERQVVGRHAWNRKLFTVVVLWA